jgi:ribosomal protein S18 acetylase RimI-like enzyme
MDRRKPRRVRRDSAHTPLPGVTEPPAWSEDDLGSRALSLCGVGAIDQDGEVSDNWRLDGQAALQVTAVSIADLEAKAARSWRATDEDWLGGWLLRAAEGFTGRANSALAAGDPGMPLARAVPRVCAWYADRGLPPMIAVPFAMDGPHGSRVDRFLAGQGWSLRQEPAIVMTAEPWAAVRAASSDRASVGNTSSGRASSGSTTARSGTPDGAALDRPALDRAAAGVSVAAEPDEDWLGMYHYRGQELPPIARRLLMSAQWQAFASVREAGQTIAIGRLAAAGNWAGLSAIETHPGHRRRGLATTVTAALADVAADRGVTGLYLQVQAENAAALALYAGLGFSDHHRYHYRVAPARAT